MRRTRISVDIQRAISSSAQTSSTSSQTASARSQRVRWSPSDQPGTPLPPFAGILDASLTFRTPAPLLQHGKLCATARSGRSEVPRRIDGRSGSPVFPLVFSREPKTCRPPGLDSDLYREPPAWEGNVEDPLHPASPAKGRHCKTGTFPDFASSTGNRPRVFTPCRHLSPTDCRVCF